MRSAPLLVNESNRRAPPVAERHAQILAWRCVLLPAIAWMAIVAATACGHTKTAYAVASPQRDWAVHPAIVVIDRAPATVYAMSDVHGDYTRMVALLARNYLIASAPTAPDAVR